MANLGAVLKKNLKGLSEYVALAAVSPKDYNNANVQILKFLVKESNMPGVYVTLNTPFPNVKKKLDLEKIDSRMIIFIDAVTKTGMGIERKDNALLIGNPQNLSDISVAMDQAIRSLPGKNRFVFFDSLSTLLLYNSPVIVAKFIHFLSGKMRAWQVKGILISLKNKKDKELIDSLLPFCDKYINMEDEK